MFKDCEARITKNFTIPSNVQTKVKDYLQINVDSEFILSNVQTKLNFNLYLWIKSVFMV